MTTAAKISPRPAFRLLTLILLICAVVDLAPATGVWRIAVGGLIGLPLLCFVAVWIGGNRIRRPWASLKRDDRAFLQGDQISATQQ